MDPIRILKPGDEALVEAFCARHPDTTLFFMNNMRLVGLEDRGERFQGTFAAAMEDDAIVALAAHFWNRNIIMEAPVRLGEVVRAAAQASGRAIHSFIGPYDQTVAARASAGLEDASMVMDSREILYALDLAALRVPEDYAAGRYGFRVAEERDLGVLIPWRIAYRVEAMGETETPEMHAETEQGLRAWLETGHMWVLELHGELVSMTGFNATTPDVVQIGGVWTPPELRSRGYARAAVAGSLVDARENGASRSILFTADDNPAAQACYTGLGYKEIGFYGLLMMAEGHRPFG